MAMAVDDVAVVVAAHAAQASVVVGMSLGGLTAMELAARHPALVRSLVMVDITPGVNAAKTKAITDFVDGPQEFASFDDLLARTIEHNPTRSESSLRRGILHNAHQQPDGSWQWRYDRGSHARAQQRGSQDAQSDEQVAAAGQGIVDRAGDGEHFPGLLQCLLRGADTAGGNIDAAAVETFHRNLETIAFIAETILNRYLNVFENNFSRWLAVPTHFF